MFYTVASAILWNGIQLTVRQEGHKYPFTEAGGKPWGNNSIYYQNLPAYVKDKVGTQDVNTGSANTLYLPTTTLVYMFRSNDLGPVDLAGWVYDRTGPYLAGLPSVNIYTKKIESGTYTIDNYSVMYLFDPDC